MLNLNVDMSRLETAAEATREVLRSFGMESQPPEEKTTAEPSYRWHV